MDSGRVFASATLALWVQVGGCGEAAPPDEVAHAREGTIGSEDAEQAVSERTVQSQPERAVSTGGSEIALAGDVTDAGWWLDRALEFGIPDGSVGSDIAYQHAVLLCAMLGRHEQAFEFLSDPSNEGQSDWKWETRRRLVRLYAERNDEVGLRRCLKELDDLVAFLPESQVGWHVQGPRALAWLALGETSKLDAWMSEARGRKESPLRPLGFSTRRRDGDENAELCEWFVLACKHGRRDAMVAVAKQTWLRPAEISDYDMPLVMRLALALEQAGRAEDVPDLVSVGVNAEVVKCVSGLVGAIRARDDVRAQTLLGALNAIKERPDYRRQVDTALEVTPALMRMHQARLKAGTMLAADVWAAFKDVPRMPNPDAWNWPLLELVKELRLEGAALAASKYEQAGEVSRAEAIAKTGATTPGRIAVALAAAGLHERALWWLSTESVQGLGVRGSDIDPDGTAREVLQRVVAGGGLGVLRAALARTSGRPTISSSVLYEVSALLPAGEAPLVDGPDHDPWFLGSVPANEWEAQQWIRALAEDRGFIPFCVHGDTERVARLLLAARKAEVDARARQIEEARSPQPGTKSGDFEIQEVRFSRLSPIFLRVGIALAEASK